MMWEVVMVPMEKGVVVSVTEGEVRSVVARVAYNRLESTHKLRPFKRQLRDAVGRAEQAAAELNGATA